MKENKRTRPQVAIEDLIRLKRAERPAPAFWADFDREMRVKQLAAIVEPRPWWAPLIRLNVRLARYQLPVSATAILALTFVTVREYRLPEGELAFIPVTKVAQSNAMPGPALTRPKGIAVQMTALAETVTVSADPDNTPVSSPSRPMDALPGNIARMVPMLGGIDSITNEPTPSARSIQANLAAVKASEPELARFIDRVPGMENHSNMSRLPVVDPLANMQSPSDTRRARVLSSSLPALASAALDHGERRYVPRLERDLTDERLYERVSRFDLEGERLAINIRL